MQPDKAIAAVTTMIGRRNARATGTNAILKRETASVLHPLWLIKGFRGAPPLRAGGERNRAKTDRSGRDADPDRAGHAGAAEPAITGRILGQILLVVVLGKVELACRRDLGGDAAEAPRRKRL